MDATLQSHLSEIPALCARYGVAHLELFGSAAGSDPGIEPNDYDFLVELDPHGAESRARRWLGLADALEQLLGRHVDLVNPNYIRNPYFREAVNRSRVVIYDRQDAQAAG